MACERGRRTGIIYTVIFAAVSFLICGMSKNSCFASGVPLTDSSVFQYIGYSMWKYGELPYGELFDHKGPLIYLINVLGTFVSLRYGVFFIELFFMTVTLVFTWKTLTLFCDGFQAMLADVICYLFLYGFFECGNLVEEYSMVFMAISIYLFSVYYLKEETTGIKIMTAGMCLAAVLLLRPNMIGIWIVFCCAVLIRELRRGNGLFVLRITGFFLLGLLVVLVPVFAYLLQKDLLEAFLDCYLVFNFEYSASGGGTILYSLLCYLKSAFLVVSLFFWGVSAYSVRKDRGFGEYFLTCAAALGISLGLCCLSGDPVPHYLMTVFPIAAIGYGYGLSKISIHSRAVHAGVLLLLIFQVMAFKSAYEKYQSDGDAGVSRASAVIREYSEEGDPITVYGNACKYYLASGRRSVSRYMYQYPIGDVRPDIMETYFEDLSFQKPSVIVIDRTFDMSEQNMQKMEHVLQQDYTLVFEDAYASVWAH